ncbi:probable E3 ubiquitin-protein ligase HERC3 [Gadus chalcogrammus]|uniref:probable E3 ubiquitin-protein ligase HERC3 n=1 Tax=Gadus chalcogrammus TaxID=1042646 RepID=UPI0024C386CE|nr:probable E3 ubiquitin-protein ligase HERC3 [Gadus chalcogrammus]
MGSYSLKRSLRSEHRVDTHVRSKGLGDGGKTVKDQPVEVILPKQQAGLGCDLHVGGVSVVGVACGSRHSFVWTDTGQAYSFGNNFYAQLGYDFKRPDYKENQLTPHLFRTLPAPRLRVACVACGERHTVFALEDGRVAACGMNEYGQVGGDSSDCVVVPRFVDGLSHVSKVACGANHCLALTGEGVLFQWGFGSACGNFSGNILRPEEVMSSPSPVRAMAAGSSHCLLLTAKRGGVASQRIGDCQAE